jgi:hypothetical protein
MKIVPAFTTCLLFLSTQGALAGGYSGSWPITVTHAKYGNGSYCLTIKDDGSLGFQHSGFVSLQAPGNTLPFGTFQLIGHLLTVTVEAQGGSGQNAGLVFVAPASAGSIGNGIYDEVYGGEAFDSGKAAFGAKDGC